MNKYTSIKMQKTGTMGVVGRKWEIELYCFWQKTINFNCLLQQWPANSRRYLTISDNNSGAGWQDKLLSPTVCLNSRGQRLQRAPPPLFSTHFWTAHRAISQVFIPDLLIRVRAVCREGCRNVHWKAAEKRNSKKGEMRVMQQANKNLYK